MKIPAPTPLAAVLGSFALAAISMTAGTWILFGFGQALFAFGAFMLAFAALLARGISKHV